MAGALEDAGQPVVLVFPFHSVDEEFPRFRVQRLVAEVPQPGEGGLARREEILHALAAPGRVQLGGDRGVEGRLVGFGQAGLPSLVELRVVETDLALKTGLLADQVAIALQRAEE